MTTTNKRRHPRIGPPINTVIFTDDTFGQIIDISPGGLSLKFIDLESPVKKRDSLDIFFGDLMLDNVKVSLVWQESDQANREGSNIISRAGLKFEELTARQKVMLDFYLNQQKEEDET